MQVQVQPQTHSSSSMQLHAAAATGRSRSCSRLQPPAAACRDARAHPTAGVLPSCARAADARMRAKRGTGRALRCAGRDGTADSALAPGRCTTQGDIRPSCCCGDTRSGSEALAADVAPPAAWCRTAPRRPVRPLSPSDPGSTPARVNQAEHPPQQHTAAALDLRKRRRCARPYPKQHAAARQFAATALLGTLRAPRMPPPPPALGCETVVLRAASCWPWRRLLRPVLPSQAPFRASNAAHAFAHDGTAASLCGHGRRLQWHCLNARRCAGAIFAAQSAFARASRGSQATARSQETQRSAPDAAAARRAACTSERRFCFAARCLCRARPPRSPPW